MFSRSLPTTDMKKEKETEKESERKKFKTKEGKAKLNKKGKEKVQEDDSDEDEIKITFRQPDTYPLQQVSRSEEGMVEAAEEVATTQEKFRQY